MQKIGWTQGGSLICLITTIITEWQNWTTPSQCPKHYQLIKTKTKIDNHINRPNIFIKKNYRTFICHEFVFDQDDQGKDLIQVYLFKIKYMQNDAHVSTVQLHCTLHTAQLHTWLFQCWIIQSYTVLFRLKFDMLITNQTQEFCHSFDYINSNNYEVDF